MATIAKVRRLANPFRPKKRRRNSSRRKMTAKQIKHFGTKRQKTALKRRKRVVVKAANPRRRRKSVNRRKARRNPAYLVTLGAVNPRRRNSMARKRKSNSKRSHRRRRSVVVASNPYRRRRRVRASNPRRRRVVHHRKANRRRRNPLPSVFGSRPFSADGLKIVAGGLLGVAAAKFIPKILPASLTSSLGNFGSILTTAISAYAASFVAEKALGDKVGSAVLFGGLMQTGSVALNMFIPGFAVGGVPLALSGLGDFVPGQFVVPQNPLRQIPVTPPPSSKANVTMNGLARAYKPAF